jgi:hypothetical protein
MENLKNQVTTNQAVPAELPQPAPTVNPEEVVGGLRALRAQMGEVTPLTPAQRKALNARIRSSNPVVQASINVIGALENVAQAVGIPAVGVRQLCDDANRWTAVEDELRTMLKGVAGANLVRRQRIALIAAQAAAIGSQLARDPENAVLLPHVQELKRLKGFARRKKAAPVSPETTPASQDAGTSGGAQA